MLEASSSTSNYPRVVLHSGHDIYSPWLHLMDAWTSAAGYEYSAAIRLDLVERLDDNEMFVASCCFVFFTTFEYNKTHQYETQVQQGLQTVRLQICSSI